MALKEHLGYNPAIISGTYTAPKIAAGGSSYLPRSLPTTCQAKGTAMSAKSQLLLDLEKLHEKLERVGRYTRNVQEDNTEGELLVLDHRTPLPRKTSASLARAFSNIKDPEPNRTR